ncbi:MAG: galactose oxidase [Candidatus Binatia bacterium]|nr:galactose oxidase [Candidatus Binatia bacterium]
MPALVRLVVLLLAVGGSGAWCSRAVALCPGDCDGSGRTDAEEIARAVEAAFGHAPACGAADERAGAAHVLAAVAYSALERPLCARGIRARWDPQAPLAGGPRQEVGVAALDGVIYVIGGITSRAVGVATVEAYDVSRGEWRAVAPLPRALHHVPAAAGESHVFTAGGFAGASFRPVDDVFRYDPTRDLWEPLPKLPTAVGAAAAAVRGRCLHVVGGGQGLASSTQHAVLDLETLVWRTAAPLPDAVNHLAAVVWNHQLYAVGGRRDPSGLANSAGLYRYDAENDRWLALAPMPTARSGQAAAVVGSWLVVFGGEVDQQRFPNGTFPHVEAYDFTSDQWWSELAMPVPRHGFGAATVDGAIYLPGGAVRAGFGETAWHDRWIAF